jgi:hypothetical protein
MLAYLCIANEAAAGLIRKVEILDRFDLPDSEIAAVCACTLQAVRKARLRLMKTRSGRNA